SVLATVDLCVTPRAPRPALFPYTTLFRSVDVVLLGGAGETVRGERGDVGGGPRARHGGRGAPPAGGQRPLLQAPAAAAQARGQRSEEHTSELQSRENLVCRLLLEKKTNNGIRAFLPDPNLRRHPAERDHHLHTQREAHQEPAA